MKDKLMQYKYFRDNFEFQKEQAFSEQAFKFVKKNNTMEKNKIFADGFIFKRPDNTPDFIVGKMSVKVDEAINFLKTHTKNGWVNMGIKKAKSGKFYMELDTWEPKQQEAKQEFKQEVKQTNDLPF